MCVSACLLECVWTVYYSKQCASETLSPHCLPHGIKNLDFSFPSFIPILTLVMGTLNTFSQVKEPEPFLWLMTNQGTFMPPRHWTERREPSTHSWPRRWTGTPTGRWSHHRSSLSRSRTLMTTLLSSCMRPIMRTCLRGPTWVRTAGETCSIYRLGVPVGGGGLVLILLNQERQIYTASSLA